jgi:hypothetical protein
MLASTLRSDSEHLTYIITTRRITSGDELKQPKGLAERRRAQVFQRGPSHGNVA